MLDAADSARRSGNSQRRVDRELYNSLRRDKVDSIQKMQVRLCDFIVIHERKVHALCERRVNCELLNSRQPHTQSHTTHPIQSPTQAYQRQLLLEKIMDENEKTARLLEQRCAIQEQRKAANMNASMHRNKVRARV